PITPCSATVTGAGGLSQPVNVTYSANTNVGDATASASFAGDANHAGSTANGGFAITPATSAIALTCPASVTFTRSALTPCSATVTGTGGLSQPVNVTYSANTNVGDATASASFAGDANHASSTANGGFAITPATSAIALTCPPSVRSTGLPLTPCSATVTGA